MPGTHALSSLAETFTDSTRPTPGSPSFMIPGESVAVPATASTMSRGGPVVRLSSLHALPVAWPLVQLPRPWV